MHANWLVSLCKGGNGGGIISDVGESIITNLAFSRSSVQSYPLASRSTILLALVWRASNLSWSSLLLVLDAIIRSEKSGERVYKIPCEVRKTPKPGGCLQV